MAQRVSAMDGGEYKIAWSDFHSHRPDVRLRQLKLCKTAILSFCEHQCEATAV
jgi:hypothetical protein